MFYVSIKYRNRMLEESESEVIDMADSKKSKDYRILDMYHRLCEGRTVNKSAEAVTYGVDERSIQRDIDDIRGFLDEQHITKGDVREVVYDRTRKGYVMLGDVPSMMTNGEILAVSKILLESRAFTQKELKSVLDKLVEGCVPVRNMKLVSELIANEKYHYVELNHKEYINDKLWEIGSDIYEHNLISIRYARAAAPRESIKRIIEPVAIMFSEYYFYLNAYILEKDENGRYVHKYDYPAVFRIDRIKSYKHMNVKFRISYANRFEEGEFRKRVQFMYTGKLQHVRIKFYGSDPEPLLDRLPTARIEEQYGNECIIEAEVYGKGIIIWLLSQGSKVEMLSPECMRNEMKQLNYQKKKNF